MLGKPDAVWVKIARRPDAFFNETPNIPLQVLAVTATELGQPSYKSSLAPSHWPSYAVKQVSFSSAEFVYNAVNRTEAVFAGAFVVHVGSLSCVTLFWRH